MISVDEARTRILAMLSGPTAETVALSAGLGRVLARPVLARLTQPPADVSAMDGYAVRAADGAAGAKLTVIGAAPAGHPFAGEVGPGEAVRLFTGSVVPAGADSVLIQEDAALADDVITVGEACQPAKNIRRKGQDFAAGEELIPRGRRLTARDIGLAAAGNHPWLEVYRRPRIALLATGDEISLPGEPIGPGGIVSSNAHALAAFVTACGGEAIVLPIAADDMAALAGAIAGARGADMLVTTGGASVGAHDLVQAALAAAGMELEFWKIAMRPGKPLMAGMLGEMPVLGLPGNPVSAFVCAWLFLAPAIERLSGLAVAARVPEPARLGAAMKANDVREDYVRATLARDADGWVVTPFPVQDSGMLRALARADALIRRAPFDPPRAAGEVVDMFRLGDL
jgi:molybdopterin molybdotransferase